MFNLTFSASVALLPLGFAVFCHWGKNPGGLPGLERLHLLVGAILSVTLALSLLRCYSQAIPQTAYLSVHSVVFLIRF